MPESHQHIRFTTSFDGTRIAYATAGDGPPIVRVGSWLTHLELDWSGPIWSHWFDELTRERTLVRFDLWQPVPTEIWSVAAAWAQNVLWGVFALGWLVVLAATFMISHVHLFGLKQVHEHLRGQDLSAPEFQIKGLYRYVRHPLNLGFLMAFWATPQMTVGHLLFAMATTGYIFVAMYLEERDLVAQFGARYRRYRARVPKIVPIPSGRRQVESQS